MESSKTNGEPPGARRKRGTGAAAADWLLLAALLIGLVGLATWDDGDAGRPDALVRQHLLVDTHIDAPYWLQQEWRDLSQAVPDRDFDYPRARAGGLDAAFMSIYIPAAVDAAGGAGALADELIGLVERMAADAPDKFALAHCAADVQRAPAAGRIALPMGMENGAPIAGELANLRRYWARGIRYITLAHSRTNHISDSSYDAFKRWQGLSPFGKALVQEMNRVGVMIDVSHLSDQAFWQVLELSEAPVLATHSSLRHFTPGFERNLSDEMVAALGRHGGVVHINFGSAFLTATAQNYGVRRTKAALAFTFQNHLREGDPQIANFMERYRAKHPYPYATVDDVLDHYDRAVALAGIDGVGVGSDYDGVGDSLPLGLKDASTYPNLVRGLLGRGYSEADVAKILGGNLMRVWRQAEQIAAAHGNAPTCVTGND